MHNQSSPLVDVLTEPWGIICLIAFLITVTEVSVCLTENVAQDRYAKAVNVRKDLRGMLVTVYGAGNIVEL
jgi:hypothetical protein